MKRFLGYSLLCAIMACLIALVFNGELLKLAQIIKNWSNRVFVFIPVEGIGEWITAAVVILVGCAMVFGHGSGDKK